MEAAHWYSVVVLWLMVQELMCYLCYQDPSAEMLVASVRRKKKTLGVLVILMDLNCIISLRSVLKMELKI